VAFDLDSYADRAETFLSELDREYHLHFSGQKRDYEVEAIYDRHASLFDRELLEQLREAAAGPAEERRRAGAYLLAFAVEGHLGRASAGEQAALAEREAELELDVDGELIPYRTAPVVQANEPDAGRRHRIERARTAALSTELNPLHRVALERSHALVGELGWPSYAEAFAELRGIDLGALADQARSFLDATSDLYVDLVDPELEAVLGFGLPDARRADFARFFRAPGLDRGFEAERLIPVFTAAMERLGLDLAAQPNIVLDADQRPTKSPRAYCAPVRVPAEVYLVVPRVGGREDFAALFHEGGHAEHYANMDPALPVAYRYLGDNSVTESFAFLFEHVTEDRRWLREVLAADPEPVTSHVRAVRIYFLRRYAAKLIYELALHGPDADFARLPERYSRLLGDATGIDWPRETWLEDVDGGFYVAAYLRAWSLEACWRRAMLGRFGERWYAEPQAGRWLRELWSQGQRLRADELLAEATGEELRFDALAEEFAATG
jgi:hypothetical protein